MTLLHLDLETYGETPIKFDTHKYAESAEVLMAAYAFDDDPVQVEDFPNKAFIEKLIADADEIVMHNGGNFDSTVLRHALNIVIEPERIFDTMACAMAHGLPGSLGTLCDVMGVATDKAKDKAGKALISLFCQPPGKHLKRGRATKQTHPIEWERFRQYAALDVEAMRALYKKLPKWNFTGRERELWNLDFRINDRGVAVDVELATAALEAITKAQERLKVRTQGLTNGEVSSATRRDALLGHILSEYGVVLPDMQGSTLERRIADPDLPAALRELLAVRLETSTTSTAKYKTLLRSVSADGRLRGLLQFCGASRTGRFCLAEGTPVWVSRRMNARKHSREDFIGYVPIEKVLDTDRVWDGNFWVSHEGVVFSGHKQTIQWDCITATPEHMVFISDKEKISLLQAKEQKLGIWEGNGGSPWFSDQYGYYPAGARNTYDIINAGPRNRFMANGRIVSNSGRLFQPQNLPRPDMKNEDIEIGIEALKLGVAELLYG